MKKEPKQALSDPEEEALEQRVEAMMEPDAPTPVVPTKTVPNKIVVADASEVAAGPPSVPKQSVVQKTNKPVSIPIIHFDETDTAGEPEIPKDTTLAEAIEQANQKLAKELPGSPPVDTATVEQIVTEPVAAIPEVETAASPQEESVIAVPEVETKVAIPEAGMPEVPEPVEELIPAADTEVRVNDAATNQAVDDIIAEESNELVEPGRPSDPNPIVPTKRAEPTTTDDVKLSFWSKIAGIFGLWWHNKLARYVTLLVLLGLVGAAAATPVTRYYILNTVGVRGGASVTVIDQTTRQPLKDVQVRLANQTVKTDQNGKATLANVKLGKTQLVLEKYAFAPINQQVTVGWGSNPYGSYNLTPVGTQYTIKVTDYISGLPLAKVQAAAGQADAQTDESGTLKLALEPGASTTTITVTLSADGYREESLTLDLTKNQETTVTMVPASKAVYVSKRNGTYDVYSKYVDGKDEQKVLAGTGNEQSSIVLVPSSDGLAGALVSTRDEERNADGYLLSTLTVMNLADNTTKTVTHSEQVFIVGWTGTRLVYVQTAAGTSAANPNRQRLMSYDYKTGDNHQVASTNYFNDVIVTHGKIYYAPSSTYQANGVAVNFFSINPDGSSKQTVLAKETWSAFRTGYDEMILSIANQEWYSFTIGSTPTKLAGPTGNLVSRVYVDSPDDKHSVWIDTRDGKGVLLSYDVDTKKESTVQTIRALSAPVYWLNNNTVVYRISDKNETADYAVNINGGDPHKISDVTATAGTDRWYAY